MLAPFPNTVDRPRFPLPAKTTESRGRVSLNEIIWRSHVILTNPAATREDAKAAKHQMLRILGVATKYPLSQMIVPPMTLPPESGVENVISSDFESSEADETCEPQAWPASRRSISLKHQKTRHTQTRRTRSFPAYFPRLKTRP